ncbi:MAG: YggS family pyridoxal phosphate-dependent enzyme [Nitrospirales bacterium]|nr:YggS family pyridoxal phosphate-dependent enzyme [Nitrospirales bacterium]
MTASEIFKKMSHAAMRAGREPARVQLVAVTKTIGPAEITEAVEIGLRIFGENRVQEAQKKIEQLSALFPHSRIQWHHIGHLQKNKARHAVGLFDLIHSIDSEELAREVNRQAEKRGKVQRVLVQVKLSEEETKHGIDEKGVFTLLQETTRLGNLKVEGLMTMPPYCDDPEEARPYFRRLREIRDKAEKEGFALPELSMGMSHDFEVAIEEGATLVRIGTALFGERR